MNLVKVYMLKPRLRFPQVYLHLAANIDPAASHSGRAYVRYVASSNMTL